MKKSEIVVGGLYGNGKGRVRKVIAEGPSYVLYDTQRETDNLRYEIVHDGTKANKTAGREFNMTRGSFASWATERI